MDEWAFDTTGMEDTVAIKFKKELEETLLDLKLNSNEFEQYALRTLGLNDNLTLEFQKERAYKAAKREWKQYNEWKESRNKARFELEEKYGFDTKHAAHLVRLFRTCIELLDTGKLNVKRSDAQELLAIRDGAWSYNQIVDFADKSNKKLDELYKTSKLPKEPDRITINNWLIDITEKYLST